MEAQAYPPFVFELDIQAGRLRVEQPEPLNAELLALIGNSINLFAATSGLRAVAPRSTGATATNPRLEQVRRAVDQTRGPNGQE